MDVQTDERARGDLTLQIAPQPPAGGHEDAGAAAPPDRPPGLTERSNRVLAWVALAVASVSAIALARYVGVVGKGGVEEVLRAGTAIVAFFAITG
ncbi:MAG TPA: hypothetical protein VNT54_02965, partial [Solirubrobacteraceae bacterium]|nr:hypothetical protein [Solirubrobacteraceae bacterium]